MEETEIKMNSKIDIDDRNLIIQEYETIVESLQSELKICRNDQLQLRGELEAIKHENKKSEDLVREAFNHANCLDCPGSNLETESIENLKKQLTISQMEKDSIHQLWQMSLKAVDALEEEIKSCQYSGKENKYTDERVNFVKETYSEAIKALEEKLLQAKENFTKHQTLLESSRQKIDSLNLEKKCLEDKIHSLQIDFTSKNEANKKIIETLESDLEKTKKELEVKKDSLVKLGDELVETKTLAARIATKDQESKNKVAEAIELIEAAVKEKETIAQRESRLIDEKKKLETHLANLAETFANRLEKELKNSNENNDKIIKKYQSEIKELKLELQEKKTFLDHAQQESRMFDEELTKVRLISEDLIKKSEEKIIELEQKLKDVNEQLASSEEICQRKISERVRHSDNRIAELEERLASVNDRLKRSKDHINREMEERVREADDRVNDAVERCSAVEKRLSRALDERENTTSELRTLQITFDREISRRESERRLLESRIRELQEDLKTANDLAEKAGVRANNLASQVELLRNENIERKNILKRSKSICNVDEERSMSIKVMQNKYEERIVELSKHVRIHQELSNRWKEEAELLAEKFQSRYKELRSKALKLQKENEILNKELLSCRQQVAQCRAKIMERCEENER